MEVGDRIKRGLSALGRYRWLIVATIAVGVAVGVAVARRAKPRYAVNASIWIARQQSASGPISSPGLISDPTAWQDLARSYIVLDAVVSKLALYVRPAQVADSLIVRDLLPSDALRPGSYELRVDATGSQFTLSRTAQGRGKESEVIERGALGDSIGRSVGFLWQPERERFRPGQVVEFRVVMPREAAVALNRDLVTILPMGSNLMRLTMQGESPGMLATTMNTIVRQFVIEAARLKRENLTVVAITVEDQLARASERLNNALSALERFKVNTITLPSENTPIAPGLSMATNPVFSAFFNDNVAYKSVQRDREALQKILTDAQANGGRPSIEALKALAPVMQANTPLSTEVQNLELAQAQLRQLRLKYTDEFRLVRDLVGQIDVLETQTIPQLASRSLVQLRSQEDELKRRIDGQAVELKEIPERTIEEMSRQREVTVATQLYTELQTRASRARLEELSAIPDVQVFDSAVAPSRPTSDTAAGIFLVAVLASIGFGILIALLLDALDRRFRYPEQATRELGLDIMGAIPTFSNPRNSAARLQQASQLVESFRSLSLSLRSAFDGLGPVQLTVSSPGPGDGKSFVSANLASALADGGYKTILVDGDIRRGTLHNVFTPMTQSPGLTEFLAGDAALNEVVRPTSHGNLFVVPCGVRRRHGPELLAGDGMTGFIRNLRSQFDAIIVDSAPLGAGIDPYALGVATGAMLIVLRTGETDRKLAQAKLEVLDRMPVRVLGTVVNAIGDSPQFKYYYYYLEGYAGVETGPESSLKLGSGNGRSK